MLIIGLFRLGFRFILLMAGIGSAQGVSRGDWQATVMLLGVVALWNWRPITDYVAERRWRY